MKLEQYRLVMNKQLIEDIGFKKSPLQINVQLLGDDVFETMISIVFNTTDTEIGRIHIKRLTNQFKQFVSSHIRSLGEKPFQLKNDILPSITTGEFRPSDDCFHIHLLISKWTTNTSFNKSFSDKLKRILTYLSKLNENEIFNLDGEDGSFDGRQLKVIDIDVLTINKHDSRQPLQDYILKSDSDLEYISKSIKTKIKHNNQLVSSIMRGKSIHSGLYLSNLIRVIPDKILLNDLKTRNDDFLSNLTKEPI